MSISVFLKSKLAWSIFLYYILIIPAFKMLRQEDQKWKASLVYIVQSCLEYMCVYVLICLCLSLGLVAWLSG